MPVEDELGNEAAEGGNVNGAAGDAWVHDDLQGSGRATLGRGTSFDGRLTDGPAPTRVVRAPPVSRKRNVHLDAAEALRRAGAADHGVLATINRTGTADLVPVCFALDGEWAVIPVDSVKPKRSTALGRIRNLDRDRRAALLVEHWDAADWSRLWWVRLSLVRTDADDVIRARLADALRSRYPQYAEVEFDAVLTFRIAKVSGWEAAA